MEREAEKWLSTPVSLQEVKSSWDAVGRIEQLLDTQVIYGVPCRSLHPLCKPLTSQDTSQLLIQTKYCPGILICFVCSDSLQLITSVATLKKEVAGTP